MPKEFYTEKDIEDMFKRGVMSLNVDENVVLTELAYEKANRLGMKLVTGKPDNPPSAPVRPYIAKSQNASSAAKPSTTPPPSNSFAQPSFTPPSSSGFAQPAQSLNRNELHERVRSAVIARLGNQVDANLLDVIIKRVLTSTGVK